MEILSKEGYSFILLGVILCFALGNSAIEVVTAKEFNITKDIQVTIWSKDTPIDSNGLMFVRIATTNLKLNCSFPDTLEEHIIWRKQGQKWLNKSSQLFHDNKTITLQLRVDQVTWDLNGSVYFCGPGDDNSLPKNVKGSKVTIITGDLPEPAIYIRHNIVGLKLLNINIYWKASPYTGRLISHYVVTYILCLNHSYCQESPRYPFCTILHNTGQTNYRCSKLREEMLPLDSLRDLYKVTIATVNKLGESRSPVFEVNADFGGPNQASYPTPKPPLNLKVMARYPNRLILQWTPRPFWAGLIQIKYTILYHKDTDHINKTKIVKEQTRITLEKSDGIEAFTKYFIYITAKFIESHNNTGNGVSEPFGPITVQTPEGRENDVSFEHCTKKGPVPANSYCDQPTPYAPDPGPDIQNTSSSRYPHNATKRNVTISWKVPPSSNWNGKPSSLKILYMKVNSRDDEHQKEKRITVIHNSAPSRVVLAGLDSAVSYSLSVALCNSKTCGGSGRARILEPIEASSNNVGSMDTSDNSRYTVIGVSSSVILFIIAVVLAVAYKCFYRRPPNQQASLHEEVGELEDDYADRYQHPDDSCSDDYQSEAEVFI